MTYHLHPLCTLFPRLEGAEFAALRADIAANGQRVPITLHDGMILDGGNRYRACVDAGVEPVFVEFDGADIVSSVLSANLHRRHLTTGQHAAIVSSVTNWAAAQPASRPKAGNIAGLSTVAARAAQSGASDRTQRTADKVAKADPALAVAVGHGKVTLAKAAEQVGDAKRKPPTPKQVEAARIADEAHGDSDPLQMIAELERELAQVQALVKAADADDQKAETMKWRRAYENAVREQSAAMDRAHQSVEREKWTKRQLMRCGKAVGCDDETKIAALVEAACRGKVAA